MKRLLLSVAMMASLVNLTTSASAQIATGGLPLSVSKNLAASVIQPETRAYSNPLNSEEAINEIRQQGQQEQKQYVAKVIGTDVKFPESGVFHYLDNGQIIWKAQIHIEGAPAIGLYLDNFDLPKGVNMYVYNANASQILGAYTTENVSPEDKLFAIQPVQGNYVNIELNIEPFVNLNDISLSVDNAAIHFEGISYLEQYRNPSEGVFIGADPFGLQGRGAECMIDAACYSASDADVAKKASIQTLYLDKRGQLVSMCSASMINSLGNTKENCNNYVLTASHCQSNNLTRLGDTTNSAFSQVLFRFNFEKLACDAKNRAQVDVISAANFVARSEYDGRLSASGMPGDFLLLELRIRVPSSYNAMLAGWDINDQLVYPVNTGKQYVGFHHPSGDIKKVSWHNTILKSTKHITINFPRDGSKGAVYGGTSGSGLFNTDNRIVGIASTASGAITDCPNNTYNSLNYYKFASGYNYDLGIPTRNLKAWLDPFNTGAKTANATNTQCEGLSIVTLDEGLEKGVNFYPNPSNTGLLNVKFDLENSQNVKLEVFNVMGAKVGELKVNNITKGDYALDLTNLSSGVYMIKCSNGTAVSTKKVTIAK